LQTRAKEFRRQVLDVAVFADSAELDLTHEIVGEIEGGFHTASLLVCWLAVKLAR
jgi:hypothetical protein